MIRRRKRGGCLAAGDGACVFVCCTAEPELCDGGSGDRYRLISLAFGISSLLLAFIVQLVMNIL
jgi:hypothetical protein